MFNFGDNFGVDRSGFYERQDGWDYPSSDLQEAYEEYASFIDDNFVLSNTPRDAALALLEYIGPGEGFKFSIMRISNKIEDIYGISARDIFRHIIIDRMAEQNLPPIFEWRN